MCDAVTRNYVRRNARVSCGVGRGGPCAGIPPRWCCPYSHRIGVQGLHFFATGHQRFCTAPPAQVSRHPDLWAHAACARALVRAHACVHDLYCPFVAAPIQSSFHRNPCRDVHVSHGDVLVSCHILVFRGSLIDAGVWPPR
jgi:hypothetical protein